MNANRQTMARDVLGLLIFLASQLYLEGRGMPCTLTFSVVFFRSERVTGRRFGYCAEIRLFFFCGLLGCAKSNHTAIL